MKKKKASKSSIVITIIVFLPLLIIFTVMMLPLIRALGVARENARSINRLPQKNRVMTQSSPRKFQAKNSISRNSAKQISKEENKNQDIMIQALIMDLIQPNGTDPNYEVKSKKAYLAYQKLFEIGYPAFPLLLKHLNDKQRGFVLRATCPLTLGHSCYFILEDKIYNYPKGYLNSLTRTGKDGKNYLRTHYDILFNKKNIKEWLNDRKDMTLKEIQIEVLKFIIKKEKAIGFTNKKQKEEILTPLLKQLKQLEAKE